MERLNEIRAYLRFYFLHLFSNVGIDEYIETRLNEIAQHITEQEEKQNG